MIRDVSLDPQLDRQSPVCEVNYPTFRQIPKQLKLSRHDFNKFTTPNTGIQLFYKYLRYALRLHQ
jgi:hypothetical protein